MARGRSLPAFGRQNVDQGRPEALPTFGRSETEREARFKLEVT